MRFFLIGALVALAACGTHPSTTAVERRNPASDLPPMKLFPQSQSSTPMRDNPAIARDFLDLTFELESGRTLPAMTRFEGPVTVRVTGDYTPGLGPELGALLHRLRREAQIDITQVPPSQSANITIETLPQKRLQALVPHAACFVTPRIQSWAQYRRLRRGNTVDWATLERREKVAIFIPSDISQQELRDCLHEELAQALGPLNDLYRLHDSVFNDDNFNTVLTGFDMLMLRIYYAPELRNGMRREDAAAYVPTVLARLNPGGRGRGTPLAPRTPRRWVDEVETALGPGTSDVGRYKAAQAATNIARNSGISDSRLAFNLFIEGRLALGRDIDQALTRFLESEKLYAQIPGTGIQRAHVAMHLSAFALTSGQPEETLARINAHLGAAMKAQNAALLATMMMIKAEALDVLGRPSEAQAVRLDSLGWARYGFGSENEIRQRLREIAALNPGNRT